MSHIGNDQLKEQVFEDLCEDLGHEPDEQTLEPVSYTHLTLPTILRV